MPYLDFYFRFENVDVQQSCRIAYIVVIAILTMTSAIAVTCCGIAYVSGIVAQPKRARSKKLKKIGLAIVGIF